MEEGEYLVILDPMPLVEYGRPFYDGQPREKNGRFARGKRIDVAMTLGIKGKVTIKEAEKILETPLETVDAEGRVVIFDSRLVVKYEDGVGRECPDTDRLKNLGRAIFAVRNANNGITDLPKHNPPQRQYLHKFGPRSAIVVYREASGYVRGYIYNSHKNADVFLENKRGR